VCRVNQILTVIAVIRIQNLRQAFISKSDNLMSRNVDTGCPKIRGTTNEAMLIHVRK
jgi:hypothetical protein